MEIETAIQRYDWGKRGKNSLVAKLYASVHSDFQIEDDAPFAELWMGTHPNGPARIRATNQPLSAYIAENPHCLGAEVRKVFGDQLPFLFKVLSINKALSVQVHPSKVKLRFLIVLSGLKTFLLNVETCGGIACKTSRYLQRSKS